MSEVDTALSKDKAAVSSLNPLATEASTLEKGTRDGEVGALIASPLAWPKWKKLYHLSIAASFAFVMYA